MMRKTCFHLLAVSALIFGSNFASAGPFKSELDQFMKDCENDWTSFEARLSKIHDSARREIETMNANDLTKRLDNEEPTLVFISLFWPSDLSEKYSGWKAYKFCSEMNFKTRKSLEDSSTSANKRIEEIRLLDSCLHVTYYKDHVPKPLDKLLACYRKNAKR